MNKIILSIAAMMFAANLSAQSTTDDLNISHSMNYEECRKFIGQEFWLLPGKSGGYLFTDKINTYKYDNKHNTSNSKSDFSKYVIKTPFYGNPYYELETRSEYPDYKPKIRFVLSENQGVGDKKLILIDVWNDKEKIAKVCDNVDAQLKAITEGCSKPKEVNHQKIKELEKAYDKAIREEDKKPFGHRDRTTSNALLKEINALKEDNCEEYVVTDGYIIYNHNIVGYQRTNIMLVFKEKTTGDIVYYIERCNDDYNNRRNKMELLDDNFVLMSHLKKQKAYYENQQFVSKDGSKYSCKRIGVEKGNYGGIRYYFTDEQGKEIAVREHELKDYKREDVFLAEQKAAQQAEIQRQQAEAQRKADAQRVAEQRQADAQKAEAQRKANLISKYGQTNGTLIFNKEVRIGFTAEMCKEAWGEPANKTKSTTAVGTSEMWDYGIFSSRALHFSNGKLVRIIE